MPDYNQYALYSTSPAVTQGGLYSAAGLRIASWVSDLFDFLQSTESTSTSEVSLSSSQPYYYMASLRGANPNISYDLTLSKRVSCQSIQMGQLVTGTLDDTNNARYYKITPNSQDFVINFEGSVSNVSGAKAFEALQMDIRKDYPIPAIFPPLSPPNPMGRL